jgi:two-component system CheB/CheR fusion protein
MPKTPEPPKDPDSHAGAGQLVVVGASAGGIEALTQLVSTLPEEFPAPIVLAQHLDPSRPSHLGEILARYSHLPVRMVTDQAPLTPGTIYVIPADRNVEIDDHQLRLRADGTGRRPMPSIDLLFNSAALAYGERLIAVILTGTGSDGASGAYQVKLAGGLVIIENPATAAYPALPASLAPTTVDFVADLERIGPLLQEIVTGAGLPGLAPVMADEAAAPADDAHGHALQQLLQQVREHSSIDFSQYRVPTILRRLQRRMFATKTADVVSYLQYLESHPDEYPRLVGSLLIKVTEFFRDAELFKALKDQVVPTLIAEARKRDNVLRLWSAGCATGEEAYSLAILVVEALGDELDQFNVQIFATDVDEDAIEFARHGIYPATALHQVSTPRREHFFVKLDSTYQIAKAIRGLVTFGIHDLGLRAPFPHIDLAVCRNVLMYFTKDLQARALQLFAFAVRHGGYLALGPAETVAPVAAYFDQLAAGLNLYRRVGGQALGPIPPIASLQELAPVLPRSRARPRASASGRGPNMQAQLPALPATTLQTARNTSERLGLLVLGLPVGIVVVDRRYDIQIINSAATRLLGLYTEPIGQDLIHLAQSVPSTALRAVIDASFRAVHQPAATHSRSPREQPDEPADHLEGVVTVQTLLGEERSLQLTCYPYTQPPPELAVPQEHDTAPRDAAARPSRDKATRPAPPEEAPYVLILIRDVTAMERTRAQQAQTSVEQREDAQAAQERVHSRMEQAMTEVQGELVRLKAEVERQSGINRTLLESNQQLVEDNLALRGANEDLQVSGEEAEASAEEVRTLNEELQATNEELVTVNEELEATVEELHAANDELQARTREMQQLAAQLEAPPHEGTPKGG